MYARLADGEEVSVRGVVRSETISSLPPTGSTVILGLHARDTVLVPADGA